jgi:hypothetical protein
MAESSDELERHIQEIRHDLRDNFGELEDKVKSAVDWRAQFEERPGTMLALAFGGGILLSALLPRGRSPRRTVRDRDRNVQSIRSEPAFSAHPRVEYDARSRERSETWNTLKAAVIGAAAGKLSEFMEELLLGSKAGSPSARSGKHYDRPTWQKSDSAASD